MRCAGVCANLFERRHNLLAQPGLKQQVFGRVPTYRQFGENHQIS
jgi:hypothetical protein